MSLTSKLVKKDRFNGPATFQIVFERASLSLVMNIQFIMLSNNIGGAEKRYANFFNFASKNSIHNYSLAINKRLWDLLSDCSISLDPSRCLILKKLWPTCDVKPGLFAALWNKFAESPTANRSYYLGQIQQYFQKNGKPDVIHCIGSASLMLPKLYGYRTIASLFTVKKTNQQRRQLKHLSHAKSYDVLHPMVADRFEQLGLPRNKMNIAPCSFIDYSTTPDLKYMDKKNIIVFCSRMVQGKGIDLLLQTALLLQDKSVPEYEIVIMGDGPLSSYVSKKMAAFNLSQVLFQGFVTQPTKVMAGAKVFCSLQDNSNYPSQSLIEAMACECSIIATDVGDTRMLIDKEVGILIPPNSPDKLADAIAELLYDPLKCQALGRAARQRALKTMRVEKYMEFLEAIYTGDLSKNIGK